jgi:hypothetical protein
VKAATRQFQRIYSVNAILSLSKGGKHNRDTPDPSVGLGARER